MHPARPPRHANTTRSPSLQSLQCACKVSRSLETHSQSDVQHPEFPSSIAQPFSKGISYFNPNPPQHLRATPTRYATPLSDPLSSVLQEFRHVHGLVPTLGLSTRLLTLLPAQVDTREHAIHFHAVLCFVGTAVRLMGEPGIVRRSLQRCRSQT